MIEKVDSPSGRRSAPTEEIINAWPPPDAPEPPTPKSPIPINDAEKAERLRTQAVMELVSTEEVYFQDLSLLIDVRACVSHSRITF